MKVYEAFFVVYKPNTRVSGNLIQQMQLAWIGIIWIEACLFSLQAYCDMINKGAVADLQLSWLEIMDYI